MKPNIPFRAAAAFLALSAILVVLVDILDIGGIRAVMLSRMEVPYLWYHWWRMPVEEPLQWYVMGAMALAAATCAAHAVTTDARRFWSILSAGAILMLVEDAGDVRHTLRGVANTLTAQTGYGVVGTITELMYFAALGGVMLYPLIRYRHTYMDHTTARVYLLGGYVGYAAAASLSWVGSAFSAVLGYNVYETIGARFVTGLFTRDAIGQQVYDMASQSTNVGFFFMDRVVEESIELMAAAALLTAALYYLDSYRRINTSPVVPRPVFSP